MDKKMTSDNFAEFVSEHKSELASGTDIDVLWGDVDEDEIWAEIDKNSPYGNIIAHYLLSFLKDKEKFISRVSSVLADGGMFSCNGYAVSLEHSFWKELFDDMKLSSAFISKVVEAKQKKQDEFKDMLHKHFTVVESVQLGNTMRYDNSEELFARLGDLYPEEKKYFSDNESKIKAYLDKRIAEQGAIDIETDSQFWHCYK